ncbi:valine--tRNA ligase [Candidatus Uhrbacteria bacterium]|jgi:valyl-tRNA synthetase|nr:valine--tRNA ligase [Candidatus Uhrbacteria bacterium]
MNDPLSLPKTYDSNGVEDDIYAAWMDSGYFAPENLPDFENRTESFTISLPPPNVTGTLHMGHAVMLAIQDAMIRFARMAGKKALWVPGTDSAAVATESKVEKMLIEDEGMEKPKEELGREEFLKRVNKFAKESHDTIINQTKKMGASLDWDREAYTLDDQRQKSVSTAFKRMYEDGLIYRGYRVINWSVKGQSTCSDDELVYVDRSAKLYTFQYSKDVPIAIATTRPETKLGDTAIAVHPEGRWKEYIGKEFVVENFGQEGHTLTLKVFGDEHVDDTFGTGALGVTTAHSPIDFEMYQKQKALGNDIGIKQVIGEDGLMTQEAGSEYAGLTTKEAKKKLIAWLSEQELVSGEEDVVQNVGTSDRFKDIVEPLPKTQWFIDVNKEFAYKQSKEHPIEGLSDGQTVTLKSLMQHVVRAKQIDILPERFVKTYFHWIDNLRDWNISRQIWFGHRIPVWYKGEELSVGELPEGDGWEQDSDTLDTWFCTGLWTFATLDWPNEGASDLRAYHPTQVLETGYDILFFWVARMILMSTYHLGEVPFETVYLHGLVRDEKGRKMSKSLGNIINPLDMISKYGADATRLSLLIGATPGNDSRLSEEKIASYRNFTNKLWNISRFVFMTVGDVRSVATAPEPKTLADRWILSRLDDVIVRATGHYERHEFSLLGELLRDFTWNEFADWYVEIAKVQDDQSTKDILLYVLENILKMWHPYMPFVTEELYKQFDAGMLMVASWPRESGAKMDVALFDRLREVVSALRNVRATYKIAYSKPLDVIVVGATDLKDQGSIITNFAKLGELTFDNDAKKPEGAISVMAGSIRLYVPIADLIDVAAETKRMEGELNEAQTHAKRLEGKLSNKGFVAGAPPEVITQTKQQLEETQERVKILLEELESLR